MVFDENEGEVESGSSEAETTQYVHQDDEFDLSDAITLIKDVLSVDRDAKEVFAVETGKIRRRVYRTYTDESGQPQYIVHEEPLRVKELFDDYRKGFLDTTEYKKVLDLLDRAEMFKTLFSTVNDVDFIPYVHIKKALQILMLSGSKRGIALKTLLTRFVGRYETEQKKGLFK